MVSPPFSVSGLEASDGPERRHIGSEFTLVLVQVPHNPERLATGGARERLLSGVEPHVRLQIVPQPEAFVTPGADVRPLTCVEPQVAAETLPQGEGLGALAARVRPLPRVEALVSPQDLPPLEGLLAEAADVSAVPGVSDHRLEAPNVASARAEAAEAVARVGSLVGAEVFGQAPAALAPGVLLCSGDVLEVPPRLGRREHVYEQDPAGTRQLQVRGGQLQLHLQTALLGCVHALPDAGLSGPHGSVRRRRTVGGTLRGALAGLLRLGLNARLHRTGGRRVQLEN